MTKYFNVKTDKSPLSYKAGEKMVFSVRLMENHCPIACRSFKWEWCSDDGNRKEGIGSSVYGEPFTIEASCNRPGFVHLMVWALLPNGEVDGTVDVLDAGAGADVDKIEYHGKHPADFREYWENIEKIISDFKPELLLKTEYTKDVPDDLLCYDFRVSTPFGLPASGYLTVPKKEGKYPIHVGYMGYSVVGANPGFNRGVITLNVNAHGIENGFPAEVCEEKYPHLVGYGFNEEENKRPETSYWQNMIVRDLCALKFAKTLENWDGKNIFCFGGSQGAFQATAVAAHDKDVTFLSLGVPWFCDLRAEENGYMNGWRPAPGDGLDYFDTVASGGLLKCPVRIEACLGDYCCPPSTVMALYNNIKTKKSIVFTQSGTHGYRPIEIENSYLSFNPENPTGEIKLGKYRHYKGGEYEVIAVSKNSETLEAEVVYKALYGNGEIWTRPARMWDESVITNEGLVTRFTFIGD